MTCLPASTPPADTPPDTGHPGLDLLITLADAGHDANEPGIGRWHALTSLLTGLADRYEAGTEPLPRERVVSDLRAVLEQAAADQTTITIPPNPHRIVPALADRYGHVWLPQEDGQWLFADSRGGRPVIREWAMLFEIGCFPFTVATAPDGGL